MDQDIPPPPLSSISKGPGQLDLAPERHDDPLCKIGTPNQNPEDNDKGNNLAFSMIQTLLSNA
jgi:hypothetical protein